jgi:polysaccharide biosynthesis protein PslH
MNILFLTTVLPARKLHGSEAASQTIIDALNHAGHRVSVVGYGRKEDGIVEPTSQEILVSERYIETKKSKFYPAFWFSLSLLQRLPYSAAKYRSDEYIRLVRSLLSQQTFDVVFIDHSQLSWLLPVVGQHKVIFMVHNVEHDLYRQHVQRSQNPLGRWVYQREADLIQTMEDELANRASQVWTLTEQDAAYFAKAKQTAGRVRTVSLPSGFAQVSNRAIEKEFDIGLIGSWPWKPNEEGLRWFLQTVYPLLPAHSSIQIAGRGAEWLVQQYPSITYRGFVPDAQAFMAAARVVAIPTLGGGGIQIKTLDAIAAGSPIVATPVALRGIADPPATVQQAADPKMFASLLVAAFSSPSAPHALEDAQAWYRARQSLFQRQVGEALRE